MLILPTGMLFAQDDATDEEAADALREEIIVTARRREESLQEIPLSVSAFSQEDIRAADLRNLSNVGDLTPGFQFMNQGNQQPGRYNTQLQFRGLTTAQFSPSFATGALFIDGIYVLNNGTSLSLMDIERVEVIKGPQSAYFGRNTFGGAVNLITRDPNMEEFAGEVSLAYSDRDNMDANFIVEGPIIKDVLSFSVSASGRRAKIYRSNSATATRRTMTGRPPRHLRQVSSTTAARGRSSTHPKARPCRPAISAARCRTSTA
jgi:iron complex outermembrane receptor protein